MTIDPRLTEAKGRRSEADLERLARHRRMRRHVQGLGGLARVLAIGGIGGFAASLAGIPLAWLLGALIASAAWNMVRTPIVAPVWFRKLGQSVVGLSIGLGLTAPVIARLGSLAEYMVLAAFAAVASGLLISLALSRITGIDRTTTFFSSMPGGVAEMSVMAEAYGGKPELVAMAQSLRILIVVLILPAAATFLGWRGELDWEGANYPFDPPILAVMLILGLAAAWLMSRANIKNSWLLGGLAVAGVIAYLGLQGSKVPGSMMILAQIMIGLVLGTRFTRDSVTALRAFLPLNVLGTVALLAMTSLCALLLSLASGVPVETLVLGLSPGGLTEMTLTATDLHLDTAEVVAFHLVRILVVLLLTDPIFLAYRHLRRKLGERV
ncbi:AbrB family transcriptional regulator [Allosediminivita pacifica]|uniref:AbrB family transcriptional regulator n=1 Tax=Allosediminivita pacifica TaxID=1267769 RepID=A0A2T6ANR3_9RHOB|nr:AbrB family transcriptional regulator [Allosediminivita pacifica]PTX45386.1 hypothetical protein C8N44_12241 [Allosediminivita pacifica]GGB20876.1 membrane protein [Allosediminivita pacifica]